MIYLFTTLYPEAKPIIRRLGLKRGKAEFGFDVYTGDRPEIRLVITGTGMVAAAAAAGAALAYDHAGRDGGNTFLVNYGSCAGKGRPGKAYLCNKIIDGISGHTFYPDVLYRHKFQESYVVTEPEPLDEGLDCLHGNELLDHRTALHDQGNALHDMEAAAIYQAASHFLGPHQMSFIKVISDSGRGGRLSAKELEEIMEMGADSFLNYLMECAGRDVPEKGWTNSRGADHKNQSCEQEFEELCRELHCSETMRMAVRQCITYWSLEGVNYQTALRQMREQEELPCRDRREGKKRLGELKKRLLS